MDLKAAAAGEVGAASYTYAIGGAKISTFDLNAGCPSVGLVAGALPVPDYPDLALLEAADAALRSAAAVEESGAAANLG